MSALPQGCYLAGNGRIRPWTIESDRSRSVHFAKGVIPKIGDVNISVAIHRHIARIGQLRLSGRTAIA